MVMKVVKSPEFLKQNEYVEGQFLFENCRFVGTDPNPRSQYQPAFNHIFETSEGERISVNGDTVVNTQVESLLMEGMLCSIKYLGKKDNKGEPAKYRNYEFTRDVEEYESRGNSVKAAPKVEEKSTSLNDLE